MESKINRAKLIQLIADSYNFAELEGFLEDTFRLRLDYIVEPSGLSLLEVVRKVVNYFDRQGNLVDLVQELSRYKPGKINILDLSMPLPPISSSGSAVSASVSPSRPLPQTATHLVEPVSRIFISQSNKDDTVKKGG